MSATPFALWDEPTAFPSDPQDEDRAPLLQLLHIHQTREDAERIQLLEREWLKAAYDLDEDCIDEWHWAFAEPYSHRTYEEELDDWNEEKAAALWWMFAPGQYVRSTDREYDGSLAWPCYGEQLGDDYDSDTAYSYHGTQL